MCASRALMKMGRGAAVCVALAVGCAVAAELRPEEGEGVTVERVDYKGWHNSYLMGNDTVEVVVVPEVARIMEYRPVGRDNVLWVNTDLVPEKTQGQTEGLDTWGWLNYGGYKMWPAPQKAWNWPPPAELDAGPCEVTVLGPGTIRLTGQPSEELGIRFDRVLRLHPAGSRLDIVQTMVNVSDEPVTWAIWEVTQVRGDGCTGFVPLGDGATVKTDKEQPLGEQWQKHGDMLLLRPAGEGKVFVSGPPGWLGCCRAGYAFVKVFRIAEDPTPEPETPREVYVGEQYVELEVVGPSVRLEPGATASFPQSWHLIPLPADLADDDQLVSFLEQQATSLGTTD
jgi:hypothetical protein